MRLFGIPLLPVLVAGIAFNVISLAWYALFFGETWIVSHGYGAGAGHDGASIWRLVGPLLAFVQAYGLALVLKWRGWPDVPGTIATAFVMAVLFALPVLAYDTVNLPAHNITAFVIDAGHLIFGWVVAGLIVSLMR